MEQQEKQEKRCIPYEDDAAFIADQYGRTLVFLNFPIEGIKYTGV